MTQNLNKDDIETIILQSVLAKPYQEIKGCRIYPLEKEGEELVIKNMKNTKEVTDLIELEDALQEPKVSRIYIPNLASITSTGLKNVLERVSVSKNIFCAFDVNL